VNVFKTGLERNPQKCERWYYAAATNSGKLRDQKISWSMMPIQRNWIML
jgi:hypothetical protein